MVQEAVIQIPPVRFIFFSPLLQSNTVKPADMNSPTLNQYPVGSPTNVLRLNSVEIRLKKSILEFGSRTDGPMNCVRNRRLFDRRTVVEPKSLLGYVSTLSLGDFFVFFFCLFKTDHHVFSVNSSYYFVYLLTYERIALRVHSLTCIALVTHEYYKSTNQFALECYVIRHAIRVVPTRRIRPIIVDNNNQFCRRGFQRSVHTGISSLTLVLGRYTKYDLRTK